MKEGEVIKIDGEEWEVVDIYTREDAIRDGVIFNAGKLFNRQIDLTTNLILKLSKEELLKAIIAGLQAAADRSMREKRPGMAEITVNDKTIWIDDNGEALTFMLPEDY